jgi:hypothetical protein
MSFLLHRHADVSADDEHSPHGFRQIFFQCIHPLREAILKGVETMREARAEANHVAFQSAYFGFERVHALAQSHLHMLKVDDDVLERDAVTGISRGHPGTLLCGGGRTYNHFRFFASQAYFCSRGSWDRMRVCGRVFPLIFLLRRCPPSLLDCARGYAGQVTLLLHFLHALSSLFAWVGPAPVASLRCGTSSSAAILPTRSFIAFSWVGTEVVKRA